MMSINYVSADEAMRLVHDGETIFIQGSTSVPEVLCEALARRGHELRNVTVYSAFCVAKGEAPYCKPEFKEAFNVDSFFVSNSIRRYVNEGLSLIHI